MTKQELKDIVGEQFSASIKVVNDANLEVFTSFDKRLKSVEMLLARLENTPVDNVVIPLNSGTTNYHY